MSESPQSRLMRKKAEKAERDALKRKLTPSKAAAGMLLRAILALDPTDLAVNMYLRKKVSPAGCEKVREQVAVIRDRLDRLLSRKLGKHRNEALRQ